MEDLKMWADRELEVIVDLILIKSHAKAQAVDKRYKPGFKARNVWWWMELEMR